MAKKRYRKRDTKTKNRKIGAFLVTNKRLSDYTYIRPAVKYLFSNDQNFKNVVKAIEEQQPGFFTDLEYNKNLVDLKTDKEKLIDFVTGRLEASQKIAERRHQHISIPELIEHEFRTEAYMSREERYTRNLHKIFTQRTKKTLEEIEQEREEKISILKKDDKYEEGMDIKVAKTKYLFERERNLFLETLGDKDIRKLRVDYYDKLPLGEDKEPNSLGYGYVVRSNDPKNDKTIILEMVRDRVGDTEYITNVVVKYRTFDKKENRLKWVSTRSR